MKNKFDWYKIALAKLGLFPLASRQIQKGLGFKTLCLRSPQLKYPVYARRSSSDLLVFDQIFVEDQYRCLRLVEDVDIIIDCGANVGFSSAYFLSAFPEARVISIEPDIDNFRILQRNTAAYGADRSLPINAAVWPKDVPLKLFRPDGPSSDWGIFVLPCEQTEPNQIKGISISAILDDLKIDRIRILKIDIEGAEVELFRENVDWLDRVDNIAIELHGEIAERVFRNALSPFPGKFHKVGEVTFFQRDRK